MSHTVVWPVELAPAANLLKKAQSFAAFHNRSIWDFAVSVTELYAAGVSSADLRWLICQGLIEQADEDTSSSAKRAFRPTAVLRFSTDTCFVLSSLGIDAIPQPMANAEYWNSNQASRSARVPADETKATAFNTRPAQAKPLWNADLGRLLLGEVIVKEFRRFAANQHLILCSFQEEDWPPRIDDPLPLASGIAPKRRLHEAISGLNRRRVNPVLRFLGDGSGEGIKWVAITS